MRKAVLLAVVALILATDRPPPALAKSFCHLDRVAQVLATYRVGNPGSSARLRRYAARCAHQDPSAIGLRHDCRLLGRRGGLDPRCAGLTVASVADVGTCVACWEKALFAEMFALIDPTRRTPPCPDETCGLLVCSDGRPEPAAPGDDPRLIDDCTLSLYSATRRYVRAQGRSDAGCDEAAACRTDATRSRERAARARQRDAAIREVCNGFLLTPSNTFCCECAGPSACVAATDADACVARGCAVVPNALCDLHAGRCRNPTQHVTWWAQCPIATTCPGQDLSDRSEMIDCVGAGADRLLDDLHCVSNPRVWCPGGGLSSVTGAFPAG